MQATETKVVGCEPITWVYARPLQFRCFVCGSQEATMRPMLVRGHATVRICVCEDCVALPPDSIWEGLMQRRKLR